MDIEERAEEWAREYMAGGSDRPMYLRDMIAAYLAGSAQAQADCAGTMPGAPIITDIGAFDRRTDELRAAGWTKEADSRDKYAHPRGRRWHR